MEYKQALSLWHSSAAMYSGGGDCNIPRVRECNHEFSASC
jgi:hypothetical protein